MSSVLPLPLVSLSSSKLFDLKNTTSWTFLFFILSSITDLCFNTNGFLIITTYTLLFIIFLLLVFSSFANNSGFLGDFYIYNLPTNTNLWGVLYSTSSSTVAIIWYVLPIFPEWRGYRMVTFSWLPSRPSCPLINNTFRAFFSLSWECLKVRGWAEIHKLSRYLHNVFRLCVLRQSMSWWFLLLFGKTRNDIGVLQTLQLISAMRLHDSFNIWVASLLLAVFCSSCSLYTGSYFDIYLKYSTSVKLISSNNWDEAILRLELWLKLKRTICYRHLCNALGLFCFS